MYFPCLCIRQVVRDEPPTFTTFYTLDYVSHLRGTTGLRSFRSRVAALEEGKVEARLRKLPLFEIDAAGKETLVFDPHLEKRGA